MTTRERRTVALGAAILLCALGAPVVRVLVG